LKHTEKVFQPKKVCWWRKLWRATVRKIKIRKEVRKWQCRKLNTGEAHSRDYAGGVACRLKEKVVFGSFAITTIKKNRSF